VTTAAQAYAVLRGLLEAESGLPPLRWQNEDSDSLGNVAIPDTPAPFLYTTFDPMRGEVAAFGGGRFNNIYRNPATLLIFVFVPRGWGIAPALDYGETAASLFRSYRDTNVSCFASSVLASGPGSDLSPQGLPSEVAQYWYVMVEVELFFDLVG
jgi:hypothetical protein